MVMATMQYILCGRVRVHVCNSRYTDAQKTMLAYLRKLPPVMSQVDLEKIWLFELSDDPAGRLKCIMFHIL